ncbi:rho GTPase-activating 35 [Micractinium conductrix]|uniref:Rho GTPase-activating 35 n=1 Tax=Micractinium conductrix TaxID=554055 RepID=A0A2P6V486_9CHLO|nr:rho GTPase-activating 35 [Micractinium conductrix]|eukprot:PSC68900.1 rho GTPase-activating 35 [Micractinium conductrix]
MPATRNRDRRETPQRRLLAQRRRRCRCGGGLATMQQEQEQEEQPAAAAAQQQPALLLLASSHDAKWGAHVTRQLEADGEMQPHLQHAKKAFQQGVARQAQQVKERLLRQSLASLPSMEDVQLREELGVPAVRGGGGAPAAKPPPRSRVLRNLVGNVLWPLFHNILAAAGLSEDLCAYEASEECRVEGSNPYCNNTRKLIEAGLYAVTDAGVLERTPQGELKGARCCARVRAALGDVPSNVMLVPWSSSMSRLTVPVCEAITAYIECADNSVVHANQAAFDEMRTLLSAGDGAPADGSNKPAALPASSPPAREAAEFAASLDTRLAMQAQARAASAAALAAAPVELPAGCSMRSDGVVVVRKDAPSYSTLAAATAANKKGKRGAMLPETLKINRGGDSCSILCADLWAALRREGGLFKVRKRSSLLAVLRSVTGLHSIPTTIITAVQELGMQSGDALQEALARGIAEGTLGGTVESPTVVTRTPTRELLMAAMQQRGILLPAFDGILSSNGTFIPVERLWADMGGAPCQVASDTSGAAVVACEAVNSAGRLVATRHGSPHERVTSSPHNSLPP